VAALGFGGGSSAFGLGPSPTSMVAIDARFGQISPDKVRGLSLHSRIIYPIRRSRAFYSDNII
jgi:hypothetical protein